MADPIDITRDITVAWLEAYETDVAIRRQKGVVPVFTPTYEEVCEFITAVHKKIAELVSEEKSAKPPSPKKKSS